MKKITLDGESLTLNSLWTWAHSRTKTTKLVLSPRALKKIRAAHDCVNKIVKKGAPVYGINTGFGLLSDVRIPNNQLAQLQLNLIRSHAVGVGSPLSIPEAKAAMLLRTNTLAKGHSGVSSELVEFLIQVQNSDIVPWIPEQGSVGACGDLAPLAHLALVLLGEGTCWFEGTLMDGAEALARAKLKPFTLGPKEGLALINGTQIMTAISALLVHEAHSLLKTADIAGAMSLDAFRGTTTAFRPEIHKLRPHPEQAAVARNLSRLLKGSKIAKSHKDCGKVQDPYSFRCMPQVHGASRKFLEMAIPILETEMNSATDNPLVFAGAKDGTILSGGNFHGQYIAIAMDTAAIALSEMANISDLRVQKLINPAISGLPAFLTKNPGLNSGMMIVQVASASLVSENKVLAHPASVDSIPTSADKEDHVSMGVTAARKCRQILNNLRNVLAMEFLCASQGLYLLHPLVTSEPLEAVYKKIRSVVEPIEEDRVFHYDIHAIVDLLKSRVLLEAAEAVGGELE